MKTATADLGGRLRQGLVWSSVNSLVLRLGTFAMGIVLARLLAPEEFGIYAVALTVQTVLVTLADLGLSSDLIRSEQPERIAPTVASLGLVSGTVLCLLMAGSAQPVADVLGSPAAGPVVGVLSLSLVLAGAGVVPYAMLLRRYDQKKLFGIALIDFMVSTLVTIVLLMLGWGVMALAVGRIAAQGCTLVLQHVLTGTTPRFGFDRTVAPGVLAFGIPVAAANMLSWALLNVDNVVIARVAGPAALGFYYLAFNISNWPMSAVGQVVRSVALPTFSRVSAGRLDRTLAVAVAPVWAVTLLIGLMLAALASPVIELVYGQKWLPAVPALMALGLFGGLRTLFDLAAAYLLARGRSMATMWIQGLWLLALVPLVPFGTHQWGIAGAGVAHLAVALLLVLPAYLWVLRAAGADAKALLASIWPPVAAAVPAGLAAWAALSLATGVLPGFLLGGTAGTLTYAAILGPWFLRRLREAGQLGAGAAAGDVPVAVQPRNEAKHG